MEGRLTIRINDNRSASLRSCLEIGVYEIASLNDGHELRLEDGRLGAKVPERGERAVRGQAGWFEHSSRTRVPTFRLTTIGVAVQNVVGDYCPFKKAVLH